MLISGESGTGKELVAQAIHDLSPRHANPMMILNCGAVPQGIFESEIFGHEKGSFTSADQRRKGYFELADKGTLFLDEIGEMPLSVQVKILRVLETGTFLRVGGVNEIKVDVRIIAATNRDLGIEVERGKFRRDLYYRLKVVTLEVPPLRNHIDDIALLARHFANQFARKNHRPLPVIEEGAYDLLRRNYWAGNVRELKNFIESLIALNQDNFISPDVVRTSLVSSASGQNLPMILNRPPDETDKELIYRTLLDLKHEMNTVKGMLSQLIRKEYQSTEYPFFSAEEVVTYPDEEIIRNRFKTQEGSSTRNGSSRHLSLDEIEREQISQTLVEFNGNRRLAAKALGIGERTLYRKIKQYDLK